MLKASKRKTGESNTVFYESKRKDMHSVQISVLFEIFLCRLLGQHYLNIHGLVKEEKWKRIVKRITDVIEKCIEKNIDTDGFHTSRLCLYIDSLKDAYKSKNITDIDVIFALTGIVFELLGGVPDYSRRKIMNRYDDHFLYQMRTLHYNQSFFQKMRTILESSKFEPFCKYHKYDDLFNIYHTKYNGDPKGFVLWYKNTYPQVYLKIF